MSMLRIDFHHINIFFVHLFFQISVHERRIQANNPQYNSQFKYAVSKPHPFTWIFVRSVFQFSKCNNNTNEFSIVFRFIFQNNYIKTSKYTLLTFLPLNLLEQFQRIANFYFLILLLLQLIPQISSLTPVTTAIPLIGVLALTAVKDAYDDIVSAHFHVNTYSTYPFLIHH